ncbi:ribonuclease-like 3 [Brienomyrus brachyistius]|uniref:ribonuclease-like 3 n=1 Tax=Brienomyrus brachyistius TaxID=42636 RepID=UPI0020B20A06|nr:ribonuclease-like 3 [Brienomyrus brachyistius]
MSQKENMASVCPTLFLIFIFGWAAVPVMSEINKSSNKDQYHKFLKQHVIKNMKTNGCDNAMKIFDRTPCKPINSFIVSEDINVIKDVCTTAGSTCSSELHISNNSFHVITCIHQGRSNSSPCTYKGQESTKKIIITCKGELPVHYAGGVAPHTSAEESV